MIASGLLNVAIVKDVGCMSPRSALGSGAWRGETSMWRPNVRPVHARSSGHLAGRNRTRAGAASGRRELSKSMPRSVRGGGDIQSLELLLPLHVDGTRDVVGLRGGECLWRVRLAEVQPRSDKFTTLGHWGMRHRAHASSTRREAPQMTRDRPKAQRATCGISGWQ